MSTINAAEAPADLESAESATSAAAAAGGSTSLRRQHSRHRRRRARPSAAASSETTTDGSFRFSDDTEDDSRSLHNSQRGSAAEECRFSSESEGISVISDPKRHSSRRGSCTFSDDEEEMVDLERGDLELKMNSDRAKRRECRICHLKMSVAGSGRRNSNGGGDQSIIELGCRCKGDLGSAHKQCAETWFKVKGNTTCEICGASATSIAGEQTNEVNNSSTGIATAASTAPTIFTETRGYCHSRRVMNFLLACMVFAFIISWLFHFKILP